MHKNLLSTGTVVGYGFFLLLLVGVGTPDGYVIAQDGSIPEIQPLEMERGRVSFVKINRC